uniref:NADH-ubiquinone oxidoreductase chain 4 n=3 Tax=Gonodactylidae TaxID=75391 RepID=A0A8K1YX22_9CRUS|nr:NADH dehydrogenase subunit 4 [Gonodactylus smithii]YP_337844.1 NADH dehydrogenase subunit 4 [Gonodactylus chiragra]ABA18056.1 NADH dehydrogenase subunit 4 [Gonodactylus chiragra]QTK16227.1 NADH dehydrogenase subunit 4 [Gonodactylus smithii]UEV86997.1 NADH dehydrogenase subunit 4 [Gonodactylellus affinis]
MLKFVLGSLFLTLGCNSWYGVQLGMIIVFVYYLLCCKHDFYMSLLSYGFGSDWLSYILILLSLWIMLLVLMSSQSIFDKNNFHKIFVMTCCFLNFFLVMTFASTDLFLFYVSFEASLIPTLILILGWGYQPERIGAGIYMLFYTLTASLPLLVSLMIFYNSSGSLTLGLTKEVLGDSFLYSLWYLSSVFAFIVKLPMFMFHLWLPKAHVEAPVAGSMILAGVLLKLGGYGLLRIVPLFSCTNGKLCWIWVSISLVGGVLVSLMCLRQVDIKALIAYSSVAHMGMVLCGVTIFNWWGVNGAVVVMVGHGLCSSGLFFMINMVYERLGSRSLLINKGLLNIMPTMAMWWFLLCAGNMAAPPTLNLLGEIQLIVSIMNWSGFNMIGIGLLSFFSAAYTLYLFSISQHGKYYNGVFSCCSGKVREYLVLMLHWLPLNLMFMSSSIMLCVF